MVTQSHDAVGASVSVLLAGGAAALLIYAAFHDLAVRTVPNWVSALLLVLGASIRMLDHDLLPALGAGIVLFLLLFVIWAAGLMGGGDVKLWAASALLVPPSWRMEFMFLANVMLLGGGLAVLYLLLSLVVRRPAASRAGSYPRRFLRAELWRIRRRAPLPYACAIAGGSLAVLLPHILQS